MGIVAVLTKDRKTIHNDIYICIIIYIMLPALYECHVQEHTRTALVCSFCSWRTNHEIYGIDLPLGRGQKELPSGNQTLQRRSHHLVRLISHWNTSKPFICRRCSIILPWFYDPPTISYAFPMIFPWFPIVHRGFPSHGLPGRFFRSCAPCYPQILGDGSRAKTNGFCVYLWYRYLIYLFS